LFSTKDKIDGAFVNLLVRRLPLVVAAIGTIAGLKVLVGADTVMAGAACLEDFGHGNPSSRTRAVRRSQRANRKEA
jgi:hypothetical protein